MRVVQLTEESLPRMMVLMERMASALPDPRWYFTCTRAQFEEDMRHGLRLFGIEDGDRLIAMASACPSGDDAPVHYAADISMAAGGVMNYCDVMTDPACRRMGLHRLLTEAVHEFALAQGCGTVLCTVDPKNVPSRKAFEKAGYRAVLEKPAYDGRPRVYYLKNLSR